MLKDVEYFLSSNLNIVWANYPFKVRELEQELRLKEKGEEKSNTHLNTIKVSGMKEEEVNTYLNTIKVSGMKEEEVNTHLNTIKVSGLK